MAAGGVEISKSSVVVADRVRDFYPRQGGRDGERRQTKRSCDFDRRFNDGRRDSYQRHSEKRRKCSMVSGERKGEVFRPALGGEKAVVDLGGTRKISSEDRVGVLKSTEYVSAVSVPSVKHPFDDLEEGQLEDDEQVVQAPNIATSKWCLESPKDEAVHVVKNSRWNRSSLSPESRDEFQVEASDERRSNSSGSRSLEPLSAHENSEHESEGRIDIDVGDEQCCASDLNDSGVDEPEGGLSMLSGSRDVNEYQKLSKINEGTYGVVYKAKDRKTEEIVALKMIKMNMEDEYGFPLTSLREINILLSCNHPSIVNVKEVVVGNSDSVFMVMEHLEHDLRGVMDRMKQPFSTSEVKCLMIQLLEGLKYLHSNWIIHRDLKPSNLLLNNSGELKICDFGMARQYGSPIKPYTQLVVTQWYRSPELLLGTKEYSTAVDMWSIGCIMGELLSLKPLFRGKSQNDIDQLQQIFAVLGTPSETTWPGFTSLPGSKAKFRKQPYNLLRKKFPAASFTGGPVLSELGFDLLNRLLSVDPEKRLTVDEALNHAWFNEVPLQKSKELMPTFPSKQEIGKR
ncbi:cyclin-dependent kinase G1 isoform X2 [Raphanus sativus]|uniref:cyclin-dependent kinase n=1 Tax=Raphanus sativus TaxID=3726 RepID=A0A6J0P455_RAPSA|nr:cyclin-dependent kinase G1 isoform X2 [Raphanus sativus]